MSKTRGERDEERGKRGFVGCPKKKTGAPGVFPTANRKAGVGNRGGNRSLGSSKNPILGDQMEGEMGFMDVRGAGGGSRK